LILETGLFVGFVPAWLGIGRFLLMRWEQLRCFFSPPFSYQLLWNPSLV